MSFLQGVQVGSNLALNNRKMDIQERQQKQRELTALSQGIAPQFENQLAKQGAMINEAKIAQQEAMLQAISGVMNKDYLKKATYQLLYGNTNDADKIVSQNPILKKQLQQKFGVQKVAAIDPELDRELLQDAGLPVDKMTDEKVKDAINATMFKVLTNDGKWELRSTDRLLKETGIYQEMTQDERDMYIKRARNVNSILKGAGILSSEEGLQDKQTKVASKELDMKAKQYDMMLEALNNGASLEDIKALIDPTGAEKQKQEKLKTMKLQEEIKKIQDENFDKMSEKEAANKQSYYQDLVKTSDFQWNDQIAQKLKQAQDKLGNKIKSKQEEVSMGRAELYSRALKLLPKVRETAVKYNRNALTQMQSIIRQYWGNGGKLDEIDELKNLDNETKLLVYDFIKLMSGQSLTMEEMKTRLEAAGFGTWTTGKSLYEGLKTFTRNLKDNAYEGLDSLQRKYPYDWYVLGDKIKRAEKTADEILNEQTKKVLDSAVKTQDKTKENNTNTTPKPAVKPIDLSQFELKVED